MFSFDQGKPVARIIGGRYNREILFIIDEAGPMRRKKKCCKWCSEDCEQQPCCGGCQLCCIQGGWEGIGTDITIDGLFDQIPNEEVRIIYIAGPSGSGKSTYAGHYIRNYKKIFPKAKVIVFSRLGEDEALDDIKGLHRVTIDEGLIEEPIDITEEVEPNSIILFDDIDTIQNKKLQLAVNKLKQDILEIGRHMAIACVITSHLINPNERAAARTLLNEMQTLTVFPKSGSAYQIKYALKQYFGLSPKQIDQILAIPSRWVTLFKNYPQIVLSEH